MLNIKKKNFKSFKKKILIYLLQAVFIVLYREGGDIGLLLISLVIKVLNTLLACCLKSSFIIKSRLGGKNFAVSKLFHNDFNLQIVSKSWCTSSYLSLSYPF